MRKRSAVDSIAGVLRGSVTDRAMLWALVIAAVSVAVYGVLWKNAPIYAPDTKGYLAVAENLARGEFDKPFHRTMGYPLFLLACGLPPSKTVVWVGLVLHSAVTVLGVWIMGQAGLGKATRIAFAGVMSLPLYAQSAGILLTENLCEFVLAATIGLWWLAMRSQSGVAGCLAGLSAAYCALVRPTYQLLPLLLVLFSAVGVVTSKKIDGKMRVRAWMMAVAPAVGVLVILAISFVNLSRHGYFGITFALGGHLCNRTALFVERADAKWEPLRTYLIEARNQALVRGKSHTALEYQWDGWQQIKGKTGLTDVELAQRLLGMNLELIVENPLEYLAAVGKAMVSSLFAYVTRLIGNSGIAQVVWTGIHFLVILAWMVQLWIYGGKLVGEFVCKHLRLLRGVSNEQGEGESAVGGGVLYAGLGLTVVYTILTNSMADIGDPRQRSPVDWCIILQTFLGWELFLRQCARRCGERVDVRA